MRFNKESLNVQKQASQILVEQSEKLRSYPQPSSLTASQLSSKAVRSQSKDNRALRIVAILLTAVLAVGLGGLPFLREIASFLIVQDPLRPAAAIVSLAGEGNPPWREIEAARLYHAGWAPRIVIVRGSRQQGLGIDGPPRELSREALIREGVPASAILLIQDDAQNTLEELQAAFRAFGPKDEPVILVTSTFHTQRARLTWEYVAQGRSRAIVRGVARDSFDPTRWWYERPGVLAVLHEYLGIINAYAGFPISGWRDLNRSR